MNINFLLFIPSFFIFSLHSQVADSAYVQDYFKKFERTEYVDQELAEKYLDSGVYLAKVSKNDWLIGKAYMYRGWLAQDKSAFEDAHTFFYKSLTHLKKTKDQQAVADAYGNLGNSYFDLQEYQKSLNYQLLALDGYEAILKKNSKRKLSLGAINGKADALFNIGTIYGRIEMYDKQLEYNYKSLAFEKLNNKMNIENWDDIAISYYGIAENYMNLKQIDSAIYFFKKSIDLYKSDKVDNQPGYATVLSSYALLKGSNLSKEKRSEMLQVALKIMRENEDANGEASTLLIAAENNFDELSIDSLSKIIKRSYQLIEVYELNGLREKYFKIYSKYNSRIGKYHSAYLALENYLELKAESDKKNMNKNLIAGDIKHQLIKNKLSDSLKVESQFAQERLIYVKNEERQQLVLLIVVGGLIFVLLLVISIVKGKRKSDRLLLNILPKQVAEELKRKGYAEATLIKNTTVLFTDFKGFTALSEILSPKKLVNEINVCFSAFDHIMQKHNIEKIKTIGDAYMAAGGLPTENTTHVNDVIKAALEIQEFMLDLAKKKKSKGEPFFEIRIGVHTGPVVAGIVGVKKFQYDIWGDTVNTASRMESSGDVGKVNISESTYEIIKDSKEYTFESRGKIEAKGKGILEMYFVENSNF